MFLRSRPTSPFEVTVVLDGRHPYLKSDEYDFPTRQVVMTVPAADWNDAERQAFAAASTIPDKWRVRVLSIKRAAP